MNDTKNRKNKTIHKNINGIVSINNINLFIMRVNQSKKS